MPTLINPGAIAHDPTGALMTPENKALANTPYSERFAVVGLECSRASATLALKAANIDRLLTRAAPPSAVATAWDALPELRALIDTLERSLPPRPAQ